MKFIGFCHGIMFSVCVLAFLFVCSVHPSIDAGFADVGGWATALAATLSAVFWLFFDAWRP